MCIGKRVVSEQVEVPVYGYQRDSFFSESQYINKFIIFVSQIQIPAYMNFHGWINTVIIPNTSNINPLIIL